MKTIERQSGVNSPVSARYPQVKSGVCEYCGTVDPKNDKVFQYQLCPHFKEIGEIRCSYCPEVKNPHEVIRISTMQVADHPDDMRLHPSQRRVIAWCDSFECSDKHLKRFKVSM